MVSEAAQQARYTAIDVKKLLLQYFRLVEVCRMESNDERLGTKPAPRDEAPTSASSRLKADIEQAMLLVAEDIGLERVLIAWMHVSVGESSWRHSVRDTKLESGLLAKSWRSKVGALFGELTPGQVWVITDDVLARVTDKLNCLD